MPATDSGHLRDTACPALSRTALYLCDNGACYCGAHAGATARFTGRDLSGQPVERIDAETVCAAGYDPRVFACEKCGRGL
jgi:hypothetical protein